VRIITITQQTTGVMVVSREDGEVKEMFYIEGELQ